MIFVTVGHQMPFDRMIRLVDQWAVEAPGARIFAQIGESAYRPVNFEYARLLSRKEFDTRLECCSSVVAHAGTGTIIQVLMKKKPLLVYPRLSRYAETRNDHQVGTAQHFANKGQLLAAFDEQEFLSCLRIFQTFQPRHEVGPSASSELLARLRDFIASPAENSRTRGGTS